ncbi:MAG: hypothetical protein A3A80_02700 [Candidatus Terrybacteria bacterium RIFCSPLOWO2_01_FULL_44_24]|uniref:Peptidase S49 domain-containing protein n=1 Tax=Candidatus Terrybacteria bacterium RIFCSPHIGHO2_01_FULL_43_35 TaxID=1802361 RepID=A0A1G2PEG9_9BACT|nr:MAG: hypothetical protein A2828_02490 [Candidatus Terrybacteria bacterium RIFCSPHIGHO2_01_FULL_43_35]OHA50270.1 MAG: hypothetical protein A3B75_00505 [Candidatus Terrybacteria bacterium RIFCSPHIGHO2_02_FULL_43_14]OHA50978.1 MAG: hypothetical protein A3A80_02700 [Candidatus Terrybacteria bacterium RIFCSPLOWO2_01_FULL_44_24]
MSQLIEVMVGGHGPHKVFIVPIKGVIVDEGAAPSPLRGGARQTSARHFEVLGKRIRHDPLACGVLLRINSPGGMASASEDIFNEISRIRQKMPVVAYIENLGASGSYMAAVGADNIVAAKSAIVGSVGVILQRMDVSEALAKLGVKMESLTTGSLKDTTSMYRPLTDEDRKYLLNEIIEPAMKRFVTIVSSRRTAITEASWPEITTGKVFSAEHARQLGLVDQIGSFDTARDAMIEYAKTKNSGLTKDQISFVQLASKQSFLENFLGGMRANASLLEDLDEAVKTLTAPGLWYIWKL